MRTLGTAFSEELDEGVFKKKPYTFLRAIFEQAQEYQEVYSEPTHGHHPGSTMINSWPVLYLYSPSSVSPEEAFP